MHPCIERRFHLARISQAAEKRAEASSEALDVGTSSSLAQELVGSLHLQPVFQRPLRRGSKLKGPGDRPFLCETLLFFQLVPFASGNRVGRVQRILVEHNLENLSAFVDEECCPPRSLGLRVEDAIAPGGLATYVAQHWEVGAQLIRPGFIGKKSIHGDTQDLGVGNSQLLQILLEALRFLGSIRRKRKDVKRQSHVLLPLEVMQRNHLPILIFQSEIGRHLSDFDGRHR